MVISYREALNQAMREEMRRDPRIFLIGEEVGYYQGAFKVSKGFVEEFGPQRVVDTPITEAGFTGLAIGAAMAGLHPIVELMTMNFGIRGLGSNRQQRRKNSVHVGRPAVGAAGDSRTGQRRAPVRRAAFAKSGGLVLPRAWIESDRSRHAARCKGPPEERHP